MAIYQVFVYGTLRRGHENHCVIEDRYRAVAPAVLDDYRVEFMDGLPFAVKSVGSRITGELYEFDDDEVLEDLDLLEGYQIPGCDDDLYVRETVVVSGQSAFVYLKGHPLIAMSD
jgi:gamma-glutamylcyclotransferase (GGCT)/AIG2-like uncharacterized protein YtfP